MSNISKQKREKILEYLSELRGKYSDDYSTIVLSEIETILTDKKYGLVWEEHEERVDKELETQIPVFTEVSEKEIITNKDNLFDFLLEGDNLHSLNLLRKTHKGKVDVIYIDPPYNTGSNDFKYDDNFVDKEDGFKHSKWLSFMNRRLLLAKEVLSEDGLIFISIDDKEQSQLKLLCDEILGSDNFVITLPRITKKSGKTTGSFSKNHDYILVYIKNKSDIFLMEKHIDDGYKHIDEFVEERGKYKLNQTLDYDSLSYSSSLDYPLEIENQTFYPGTDYQLYLDRKKGNYKRADWAWRWSEKLFKFGHENGFVVVKRRKDGSARIYTKTYLNAKIKKNGNGDYYIDNAEKTKPISSIDFIDNIYSNDNAKKDLKTFKIKDEFDYSKPVALLKRLIRSHKNKDAIILDFFAGSGTTGQAVIELNKEDGGNRRFILCTNNENEICENITYKRISDVVNGYEYKGNKETIIYEKKIGVKDLLKMDEIMADLEKTKEENEGKYDKTQVSFNDGVLKLLGVNTYKERVPKSDTNLKYYKTNFIPRTHTDDEVIVSDQLMDHIKEMVQLENHIRIDNQKYIIVFDEKQIDELFEDIENVIKCKSLYMSSSILLTKSQENAINDLGIEVFEIPEYYFANELRAVGEIW